LNNQNKEITKVTVRFSLSQKIIITNLEKLSKSFQNQNIEFKKFIDPNEEFHNTIYNSYPFVEEKLSEYSQQYNIQEINDLNKLPMGDMLNEIFEPSMSVINENEDYVNELEITIHSNDKQIALFLATKKAQLICNKLSFKSKTAIIPKLRGYLITYDNNTNNVAGINEFRIVDNIKIKLTENELSKIEDNILNDSYEHYSRGILALDENNDPVTAIREFYQIIENNKNKFEKTDFVIKYKSLRDTLSHGSKTWKETRDNLEKEFNKQFEFTERGTFDYASKKNISNLLYHSQILKDKIHEILS
jgi:hypothetical protein